MEEVWARMGMAALAVIARVRGGAPSPDQAFRNVALHCSMGAGVAAPPRSAVEAKRAQRAGNSWAQRAVEACDDKAAAQLDQQMQERISFSRRPAHQARGVRRPRWGLRRRPSIASRRKLRIWRHSRTRPSHWPSSGPRTCAPSNPRQRAMQRGCVAGKGVGRCGAARQGPSCGGRPHSPLAGRGRLAGRPGGGAAPHPARSGGQATTDTDGRIDEERVGDALLHQTYE